MVYEPALTHKNRKYMSKRCAGFCHFGEVNYSCPRRVVHCEWPDKTICTPMIDSLRYHIEGHCTAPTACWMANKHNANYKYNPVATGFNHLYFADDIFKFILLYENRRVLIQILLTFASDGSINGMPVFLHTD